MDKDLEIIELELDEANGGINTIAFVEFPAMESNFVAFNEHKVEFKTIDEDKRIVVGVALIPNKKIFRKNKGGEYYVTMSEDTVRNVSQLYLKNQNQHSVNLEHDNHKRVKDCYIVESWIVDNPELDKSVAFGLEAPKGSWVISYKIENEQVWSEVKNGTYLGFSIEGFLKPKLNEDEQDNTDKLLNEIIEILKK
jgi:hypothetical protein